jgi:RimJ/RimL family protein N-acetyltransferase
VIALPLETPRLLIRPFDPDADAEPLHELWGDPHATRYLPGAVQESVEGTRARLGEVVRRSAGGWGFWALEERGGRVVGGAGLFPLAWEGPEIELAYHVVPSAQRRGYATEAAAALLDVAWDAGLDHVVAVAMEGNAASRRVMAKLGMRYEGHADYRELDVVRYAIDRPATS